MDTMYMMLQTQFESQITSHDDLHQLWNGFKCYLCNPSIDSQGQAYQIFSTALKITRIISELESLKELWFEILNQGSFTVSVPDKPVHSYNFQSIMQLGLKGEENFKIDIFMVDREENDLCRLSKDIDCIANEALGGTPGAVFFENMLKDPHSVCLLAQHENTIVGCLYGNSIHIDRKEKQAINVLHLRFIGRKADYPSINFIQLLKDNEKKIYKKFPELDYLSLCVVVENTHALQHYQELGFLSGELIEKGFQDKNVIYMTKKIGQRDGIEPPTHKEFTLASKRV